MAISATHFLQDLVDEHFDEASVLHEQKTLQLEAQEITWTECQTDEQRFDAHLDALVVDAADAEPYLVSKIEEFDCNELFVYVSFLIRIDNLDTFMQLLKQVDLTDWEKVEKISLALIFDVQKTWLYSFQQLDFESLPHYLPIFVPIFVFRNVELKPEWFLRNQYLTLTEQPLNVLALGKSKSQVATDILAKKISTLDEVTRKLGIAALYKLGHGNILAYIKDHIVKDEVPFATLALGCDHSFEQYCKITGTQGYNAELVQALGIIGLTENIPLLITLLGNDELAQEAAEAIYIISGIRLTEEIFLAEEWDEAELFEDELEKFEAGEVPEHPDGRPFGETIEQIIVDPKIWAKWWLQSKDGFSEGRRYRFGKLLSPASLIEVISTPTITNNIRAMCLDELEIRYGLQCFIHFESTFAQQSHYLNQLTEWAVNNDHKFVAGVWYFNGKQIE
ncbi:MAG: hypothetical protein HRT37_13795 [Alteromonadaceae bacterium]|nr:hypothetical protein [Alteromonadaceae bacterium]